MILLPKENLLPSVTTRHHMVNRTRILKPLWPCHALFQPSPEQESNFLLKSKDPIYGYNLSGMLN
jgi:hypothetical protein